MKTYYISDIHLEFRVEKGKHLYACIYPTDSQESTLVLAGDIGVYKTKGILIEFITGACNAFKHVIYVLGNHEFYGSEINHVFKRIKEVTSHLTNLHILHNETVTLDNQRFIGTSLFADLTADTFWNRQITERINDFKKVSYNNFGRKITAMDMKYLHNQSVYFLQETITPEDVVITHWLPSPFCIDERYKGDSFINYYYASKVLEVLPVFPKAWIYGHTHIKQIATLGDNDMILACNPIGYYPGQAKYTIDFKEFIEL